MTPKDTCKILVHRWKDRLIKVNKGDVYVFFYINSYKLTCTLDISWTLKLIFLDQVFPLLSVTGNLEWQKDFGAEPDGFGFKSWLNYPQVM